MPHLGPLARGHSDFWESLGILHGDSVRWTEDDVYRRSDFALRTTWAHGTSALRTHLDTTPGGEGSHAAVQRLKAEWRDGWRSRP